MSRGRSAAPIEINRSSQVAALLALILCGSLYSLRGLSLSQYTEAFVSDQVPTLLLDEAEAAVLAAATDRPTSSEAGGGFLMPSAIYDNVTSAPELISSGPRVADHPHAGGLFRFRDVCVTTNVASSFLRGIVYFVPDDDEQTRNELRCAACSAPLNHPGGWNGTGRDSAEVRHRCGFVGAHAMFASSAADWSRCRAQPAVRRKSEVWGQIQTPSSADAVHYFEEPVFVMNFQFENIGHGLFDSLLMYLPHWYGYAFQSPNGFPFGGILADSFEVPGCLKDSDHWMCEILRAIKAFGDVPRLPPSPDDATLYCYKSLYVLHSSQQRTMGHPGWLPKRVFDKFRDTLFEGFDLPRRREHHALGSNRTSRAGRTSKKLLFYAHEPSGRRVWKGMTDLVENARNRSKYRNAEFRTVRDFELPIREQARLFNEADAHVMVHGAQMANSIFSVDGAFFVEVGCVIPEFLSAPGFLRLLDAKYRGVRGCRGGARDGDVCIACGRGDPTYANFTMKGEAFERLVDEVLSRLEG